MRSHLFEDFIIRKNTLKGRLMLINAFSLPAYGNKAVNKPIEPTSTNINSDKTPERQTNTTGIFMEALKEHVIEVFKKHWTKEAELKVMLP